VIVMLTTLTGAAALAGLAGAGVLAQRAHRRDAAQRQRVWRELEALRAPDPPHFDPAMTQDLPEPARHYFARAIAPGAPLHRLVSLEMDGEFILNGAVLAMRAREILAPPGRGFVWQAAIGTGLTAFAGSDGYRWSASQDESWTKFWLYGLVPLVRTAPSQDHARAAATRAMLESVWAPASLLPQFGAQWTQTGDRSAEIRFPGSPDPGPMHVSLDGAGDLVEVSAMRWSNANPEGTYRLQPFGGRMLETDVFQGFRIPTRVEFGNQWGRPDYAPFFRATIRRAVY
jgi:hypothetical protein